MMNDLVAIFLIFIAGAINGSFALPTKHIKRWRFENIWLQYSIWAFVLLPWIAIFILAPQVFQIYHAASWQLIMIMILGGFLFGAGQIGFAFSMSMIGIGLAFVICLGLGTGLGFLLPLVIQHPNEIATPFGILTLVGTAFAILGLVFSTTAGKIRNRERRSILSDQALPHQYHYVFGVLLAIVAGIFSAGQNFSFSMTSHMQTIALHFGASSLGAANIMWPGFLIFSFIPYAAYMLYLHFKNNSFKNHVESKSAKYYFFAFVMGAFWFGSLIFYSKASHLIGDLGPLVGWPLFMTLIILTSNFWGWLHHEWSGCSKKVKHTMWLGLLFLILAVVILGYSSWVHA